MSQDAVPGHGIQPVQVAIPGEEPEVQETDLDLRRRFLKPQTILSFVVAFVIIGLFVARTDLDVPSIIARVQTASPVEYILAFVVYYSTFFLRGARWKIMLQNVGLHLDKGSRLPSIPGLAEIIFLSWFANCIVPAKLGDAYRGYMLKKTARVSFAKSFGTIFAERIIDVVVLFLLLALSALSILQMRFAGAGDSGSTAVSIVEIGLVIVVLIGVGLIAMRRFGGHIERLLPARVRSVYARFHEGTLGSFQRLPPIVALTVLVWAGEVGRLAFVTQSLGIPLPITLIIFVALANSLLTAVPFTPGGLGLVEAGVIGLLMIALPKEDAVSIAILDRTISYWSLVIFGLIGYIISRKK